MKKITLIFLLFISNAAIAQEKMLSNEGIINFEASIPLLEEVKARNEKTTCILMTKTGQLFCWTNIKDFKFERSLMEEHFNKNYMESHRFPKAFFKGIIEKFDLKNITSDAKLHQINGKITIRGNTKKMLITGTLKKVNNGIELYCAFPLNTTDLKIEIPTVVRSKISKNVNTQIICLLQ